MADGQVDDERVLKELSVACFPELVEGLKKDIPRSLMVSACRKFHLQSTGLNRLLHFKIDMDAVTKYGGWVQNEDRRPKTQKRRPLQNRFEIT